MAAVAKLAVVVVLDDPCAPLTGPVEQFDATLQCQCHASRALVRWRHYGQARLWIMLTPKFDVEAMIIHWHIPDLQVQAPE